MKKILAAIAITIALILPVKAWAQEECHTMNQLMLKVHDANPDVVQHELNPVQTKVFLKNVKEVFGVDIKGIVHVHIVSAPDRRDVFVVFTDKAGCMVDGGQMDGKTVLMLMAK